MILTLTMTDPDSQHELTLTNIVQSRNVIARDISRDCAAGPCSPTSLSVFCRDCSLCSVGFRYKMRASRDRSLQPLIDPVARSTFSYCSDTRSSGQKDRCSLRPRSCDSRFFISLSAQVRHLCAVAGADGDWLSHLGFSSARVVPGSPAVVISVISRPNGSCRQR
jgi:hypothetical protein